MSKYGEMCEVAALRRKTEAETRDRCWGFMSTLVNGLMKYCEIPSEQISFLRWNEARGEKSVYRAADDGMKYSLPGAMVLDEEDGYWNLGVRITFTPPRSFPQHWVFAVLCVSECEGKPMVRVSVKGKPRPIDFNDPSQCDEFYDGVVESIKQCLRDPRKSSSTQIGFTMGS